MEPILSRHCPCYASASARQQLSPPALRLDDADRVEAVIREGAVSGEQQLASSAVHSELQPAVRQSQAVVLLQVRGVGRHLYSGDLYW